MKQIVMLEAMHWNEKLWAKVMSRFGKVALVQLEGFGFTEHVEVWQDGQCVRSTPPKNSICLGYLDMATFGLVLALTTLKRAWPVMKSQRTDLVIASANSMVMAALFFRAIGWTRKVVCLVGDYFPPQGTLAVRVYRRISRYQTGWLARRSDEVWLISPRIPITGANPRNFLVPIWMDDADYLQSAREEIGYIGM